MKSELRLLSLGILSLSLFTHALTACINTSYSRLDEIEITDDLLPLILGAFPHHGAAFYEHEIIRTRKILKSSPKQFEARNDLGSAYTKLKKWKFAQAEFEGNEKLHPSRYETSSNLGVMFKKKGDYAQAEKYIAQALGIKPGGHMGLGDYYLKMIQWLAGTQSQDIIEKNFLGIRYNAGPEATAKVANEEYVVTLIKNDYQFPDAYVVLGDILFTRGDYQLALRAYHRAQSLIKPTQRPNFYPSVIEGRYDNINTIWDNNKTPEHVIERGRGMDQIYEEFDAAKNWLNQFQKIELQFIQQGKATPFKVILAEMENQNLLLPTVLEAGFYKGSAEEPSHDYFDPFSIIASIVILLTLLAVIIVSLWVTFRYIARRLS
ncbi:MAG: tetratricopeptide repeat protein [Verrucomicrobiales bacterium]|nr:tetratricopeptide repeat protein [Verrucomicrobiales bacterium]